MSQPSVNGRAFWNLAGDPLADVPDYVRAAITRGPTAAAAPPMPREEARAIHAAAQAKRDRLRQQRAEAGRQAHVGRPTREDAA